MLTDAEVTRRCYICNVFFEDRVKLGVHLLRCYHEAVHVRGELWYPHPSDLMDKQEDYTAYMRKNVQKEREDEYRDLQRRNIPVASASEFDAIRGAVNAPRSGGGGGQGHAARVGGKSALKGGNQGATASRNQVQPSRISGDDSPAPPLRSVVPGSDARPVSPAKVHHQDMAFAPGGGVGQPAPVSPTRGMSPGGHERRQVKPHYQPAPQGGSALDVTQQFGEALDALNGSKIDRRSKDRTVNFSAEQASEQAPSGSEHGSPLITCVKCGKQFGKKGYQVHVQRCGRDAQEDFTFSRDARRQHPRTSANQIINQDPGALAEVTDPQDKDKNWTQFMVTYPKPVIEESPMTAQQRDKLAAEQKSRREMQAEMDRVNALHGAPSSNPPQRSSPSKYGGRPPSPGGAGADAAVQCKNCKLMFNPDMVQKHLVTCKNQPRPF